MKIAHTLATLAWSATYLAYVAIVAAWWILSLGWLHEARDLARKELD